MTNDNRQADTMSAEMAHDIILNTPDGTMNFFVDRDMTQLVLNLKPAGEAKLFFSVSVLDTEKETVSRRRMYRWEKLSVQGGV